ncbi:cell envelope integrity protein TolA [Chromohalobacter israelensis]|uniref:cell envelope integrity protein TolA n=1 Tax=Chromohalobacter israelensis TaxID=141390 RepID=UPI00055278EF|nr:MULTISPECIES: cell envelope integrity protein TolA [Chromohalobacter]MBZ5877653.1 cell envelope integrity protein TolA [Chromohalobacter salexigens]MDF9435522.1 cell envelope integrity protein TolA [Chromohalobacter israelensis]
MAKRERRVGYGWPTLLAIGVHVAALLLTIIKWPASEPEPTSSSVVQATLVRAETATDQPQQTEESAPAASQAEEETPDEPPAPDTNEEAPSEPDETSVPEVSDTAVEQARAEAQRLQEEAERAAQARAEAEAERQRQQEEAERRAEAERQRQQEEAERQAEAERQRQQEEAERQAEAERKRQQEEAERQAEAERKRQQEEAEAARQRELAERAAQANASSLESMISEEQQSIANAEQAREAANGFKNLVRRYVEQSWNLPPSASRQLRAIVRIQLLPTGELVGATITQSSGDAAFDRSVINAVERAAPFREMSELDASVQRQFREFNLDFNPEDIR